MKTIRVLLLEDNPGDARLFREFLHEDGLAQAEVDHVGRLKTGLEHLTQEKPDVILLDLGLPDSQGLDTFTQVYAQAPDIPIVVLTGLNDTEQAVEAVKAGAQDYLVKGEVSGGLLVRAIRYAMERKRTEEVLLENFNSH
jgi:DNA-binding response OmpR family regulator